MAFFSRNYPQAYLDSAEITVWVLRQGMKVEEVPVEMRSAEHSSVGSILGVVHAVRACLAMLIDWIRKHPPKKPLPRVSGLTPEQQLALEDDYNQRCIDYARANLPL